RRDGLPRVGLPPSLPTGRARGDAPRRVPRRTCVGGGRHRARRPRRRLGARDPRRADARRPRKLHRRGGNGGPVPLRGPSAQATRPRRPPPPPAVPRGPRPARRTGNARRPDPPLGGHRRRPRLARRQRTGRCDDRRRAHLGALRTRPRRPLGGRSPGPAVRPSPVRGGRSRGRRSPTDPLRGMRLALAGVSHHRAPLEVRERVAVDLAAAGELAHELAASDGPAHEAVVLSTCNRTEVYVAGEADGIGTHADRALLELAGSGAPALAPAAYRLADESAALHLFRVAAGLDSMVPGEGEILGQVRDAYEAGAPGPLLDRVFRMALHAGRRARVETAIGESPASVPAAAAALAQQVFERLDGRRVVLVGAGRMSELTARNLRSRG